MALCDVNELPSPYKQPVCEKGWWRSLAKQFLNVSGCQHVPLLFITSFLHDDLPPRAHTCKLMKKESEKEPLQGYRKA